MTYYKSPVSFTVLGGTGDESKTSVSRCFSHYLVQELGGGYDLNVRNDILIGIAVYRLDRYQVVLLDLGESVEHR